MSFKPRPYQETAVRSVIEAYRAGKRQLLLRLPTGAGKTVISALLIEQLRALLGQRRVLFLAHRREIIDQTADKIGQQIGASLVSIEQAERKAGSKTPIVVASVQTLAGRLDDYPPAAFGALIVDECHHAYAKTWMDVISHFGSNAETLLLGLTATPKRTDGRCVGDLFKETAFEISLAELQEQGFLVPMDYYTIEASLGLGELSLDQSGDFQSTLLGKIMNSPEVRELTVRACLQRAAQQKIIAFCASVEHAKCLAADFAARGIRSSHISGETPDRDSIIEQFRSGQIQFLSNYGVLTEGFDDPSIECVLLARPTTSPLVYSQCLGRGLRSSAGKRVCTVIDIVDRQRQQLQYNAFEAAGLKRSWRGSGKDPLREAAAIARIRVADPSAFLKLRNALSLHETQDILMGLDPSVVFAGIDGMPLVRYQRLESGTVLSQAEILERAQEILSGSSLESSSIQLHADELLITITAENLEEISPYLSWHLEQATGCKPQLNLVKAEVPATVEEVHQELEYIREEQEPLTEAFLVDDSYEDDTVELIPAKINKPALGLKARLNILMQESQQAPARSPTAASELPEEQNQLASKTERLSSPSRKAGSIQDRMQKIKAEAALSLGRNG